MPSSSLVRASSIAALALLVSGGQAASAAGAVGVTVNGNTLTLNPSPTERAGRVFVPLRGVFENLGASVVYAAGVINATGRGHTVSLKIGSNAATVDGQQQTLDVAPFIIGASTYVPLRFVSQALGATVNYDGSNRIVAINTSGNAPQQPAPVPQNQVVTPVPGTVPGPVRFTSTSPANGAHVTSTQPTIQGTFERDVDPNSVKVYLDELNVTGDTNRSPRGFSFQPRSPLQSGGHSVRVTGVDRNGTPFRREFGFFTP